MTTNSTPNCITARPVAFSGTESERQANIESHNWFSFDPEETPECMTCCAKRGGTVAQWPCGTEPPRETVTV